MFTTFRRIRWWKPWLDFLVGGNEHREYHLHCHCRRFRPLARTCPASCMCWSSESVNSSSEKSLSDDDSAISMFFSSVGNISTGTMCTWLASPGPPEASLLPWRHTTHRDFQAAVQMAPFRCVLCADILFGKASNYKWLAKNQWAVYFLALKIP